MHLLSAKPGGFVDEEGIIDLEQTPANVVILSAADTTLGLLARTLESLPEDYPSVRLANFLNLTKPAALDLYTDKVINQSNVVILSLLGGASYWPYGLEQLTTWAEQSSSHHLIIIPGDDQPDPELTMLNTEPAAVSQRIWRYLREG
ncbi:MAG: cobaltochelatase subunit CobN, partial [Methylococcales bacterium]|nr:cobaltochelatase subunit CobN [Methylococcales bacterium]